METSSRLTLPYIMPSQAQKHVTHNDAVRRLDALVHASATSRAAADPPPTPEEGQGFVVASNPGGAWQGHSGDYAVFQDGAWSFTEPFTGLTVWVEDEARSVIFNGADWVAQASVSDPEILGVNATPDLQDRFAVSATSSLFSHEGAGHHLKINKASDTETGSVLYQSGFSSRAETGLNGSDDFSVKVSTDGTHWQTALVAHAESGAITMPNSSFLSSFAVNLLQDSGRFCPPTNSVTAGAFAKPAYLQEHNNAALSALGKFINNNSNHGGSGGALDAEVLDLVTLIRDSDYRRYGSEFHAAALTMGSGTNYPVEHLGNTFYLSLTFKQGMRLAVATVHFYARAIVGDLLIRLSPGQSARANGGDYQEESLLLPAGGPWQAIQIRDKTDPYRSWGYSPSHINLAQRNPGDQAALACLTMIGGETQVDPNVGIVPALTSWPA